MCIYGNENLTVDHATMKVVLPDFTLTLTVADDGSTTMTHQFRETGGCPVFQSQMIMCVRNALYDMLQAQGKDVVECIAKALDDQS